MFSNGSIFPQFSSRASERKQDFLDREASSPGSAHQSDQEGAHDSGTALHILCTQKLLRSHTFISVLDLFWRIGKAISQVILAPAKCTDRGAGAAGAAHHSSGKCCRGRCKATCQRMGDGIKLTKATTLNQTTLKTKLTLFVISLDAT